MLIFASDLDNTLIYSHKRDIGDNKILVELYEGREVSYMTTKSYELLQDISMRLLLVPLTTRSIAQYERLMITKTVPEYALTSNGGVLLRNGKPDAEWQRQTAQIVRAVAAELDKAQLLLQKDRNRSLDVRFVDDCFVFTKTADITATMNLLANNLDCTQVNIFNNGVKIYVLPKALSKGMAVQRLRQLFEKAKILCAGDSDFDIPALEAADYAYCPPLLYESVKNPNCSTYYDNRQIFSDWLLENIKIHID